MNRLIDQIVGIVSALALLAHTVFLGVFLFSCIILRFFMPTAGLKRWVNTSIVMIAATWIEGILWWINWVYQPKWHIEGTKNLKHDEWYLITANHQSWVDIFVLYHMYLNKVPLLKFFIKKELGYLPIVGQAWWALDFPFMRRYSKAYLEKYPEKAGEDIKETQKACEKFSYVPTSVMNFMEGTRYTPAKHKTQGSPYKHLLKPKAGGIAFTIQALGDKFSSLSNVTIVYPNHTPTFWDMMCGRVDDILVRVEDIPIPKHFSQGDYQADAELKLEVQQWVTRLWQDKDRQIDQMLLEHEERKSLKRHDLAG
ncbi:acyltransferase [Litoribrevibacter albus]|uniref:Acyltransferase n=1 Tax=Litoribrevibacter albus TaxID=1473156 RepID=A0AA37S6P5_9GAMM|nr:acyltransferase [Litoribrevibacter albus]GLQ29992.1 acyltransferase [Litoribrevibacter albus]